MFITLANSYYAGLHLRGLYTHAPCNGAFTLAVSQANPRRIGRREGKSARRRRDIRPRQQSVRDRFCARRKRFHTVAAHLIARRKWRLPASYPTRVDHVVGCPPELPEFRSCANGVVSLASLCRRKCCLIVNYSTLLTKRHVSYKEIGHKEGLWNVLREYTRCFGLFVI